jgi:hypothetical protein
VNAVLDISLKEAALGTERQVQVIPPRCPVLQPRLPYAARLLRRPLQLQHRSTALSALRIEAAAQRWEL